MSENVPYDIRFQGPDEWSVEDVIFWMAATNQFQYAHMFLSHSMNGRKLLGLDEMKLAHMEIHDEFHRKMILACINELIGNSETVGLHHILFISGMKKIDEHASTARRKC